MLAATNTQKYLLARAAFRRLVNTDEGFTHILEYLQEERLRLLGDLTYQHAPISLHQHQGAVQVLDGLFAQVRDSQR